MWVHHNRAHRFGIVSDPRRGNLLLHQGLQRCIDAELEVRRGSTRSDLRGFKLPIDVGRFLLNRLSRDMRTLLSTLNQLDNASFSAKRKLTIPFVKEILAL